jgi:DNA-binding CsgD family transcriptional regulator
MEYVVTYWNNVLREVLNRDRPDASCMLTPLGSSQAAVRAPRKAAKSNCSSMRCMYFIGPSYPGVYFTRREAQCVLLLVRGYTLKEIGSRLGLSPRTIECYSRNVRAKLCCGSRSALIEAIVSSHFDLSQIALPERADK